MDLRKKHAESEQTLKAESKQTPKKDTQEDPVSWSDLDKAAVYTLLTIFCFGVVVMLIMVILLYRDRFGVSTEFEQRLLDFIAQTLL